MVERCDYYSDDEYEIALAMQEEDYLRSLAEEEAFKKYCFEEYCKELSGVIKVFEVQLGVKNDVVKDTCNYVSPKIILVKSEEDISIKDIEERLYYTIKNLDCDCVYGINLLSKDEFNSNKSYYENLDCFRI